MGGACSTYEGEERPIKVLVVKPEGRRRLVKPRHRWEYNIKMNPQKYGGGSMDWIDLAQDNERW